MALLLCAFAGGGEVFRLEPARLPSLLPAAATAQSACRQPDTSDTGYTEIEIELWRQALLLAARTNFGLLVEDRLPVTLKPSRLESRPAAASSFIDGLNQHIRPVAGYALRLHFERSICVLTLRLLAPDGHEIVSRTLPTGEGCSQAALQKAERYSREEMPQWLELAGIPRPVKATNGSTGATAAIPERVLRAAGSFRPLEILAAIQTLEEGWRAFPQPQTELLLTRLYSEAYLLSAHHPGPEAKRYLARAFLYAQRASVEFAGNAAGHYALAYAYALSGQGALAVRELDWARMERPLGESEESWVEAVAQYLRCDVAALTGNRFGTPDGSDKPSAQPGEGHAPFSGQNSETALPDWPLRLQLASLLTAFAGDPPVQAALVRALREAQADADHVLSRAEDLLWWTQGVGRTETASPLAPAVDAPLEWRESRQELRAARGLFADALGLQDSVRGPDLPPIIPPDALTQMLLPAPTSPLQFYANAKMYPLLRALDRAGEVTARVDAIRDGMLYDMLEQLEQKPFAPEAKRWLAQAQSLWPDHPGIMLWMAGHSAVREKAGNGDLHKQYRNYPAIGRVLQRTDELAGKKISPGATPTFLCSPQAKLSMTAQAMLTAVFAHEVYDGELTAWSAAAQRYAQARCADTPEFYLWRNQALDLLAKRWAGRMRNAPVPVFLRLIRDGAGLGRYRTVFTELLRAAPEDAAQNNWALHLRTELETCEPAAYTSCWRLLSATTEPDEAAGNTHALRGKALLEQPCRDELLNEFGSTQVVLLAAQMLQQRGDNAQAQELAQREIGFYRLYARAFRGKPKGLVRGLHALADSPLTASAALEYYDQLQAALKNGSESSLPDAYHVAEVALSAGRAAFCCGDRERAARFLAQVFTEQRAVGGVAFYRDGIVTYDIALAGRWLLEDLLSGEGLSASMRTALEQAGVSHLYPQVWK